MIGSGPCLVLVAAFGARQFPAMLDGMKLIMLASPLAAPVLLVAGAVSTFSARTAMRASGTGGRSREPWRSAYLLSGLVFGPLAGAVAWLVYFYVEVMPAPGTR